MKAINMDQKKVPHQIFLKDYPVRKLLSLISDSWTPIVFHCLSDGTKRFSEIHKQLPEISPKMLTQVLRRMENDGFLERKVYPVIPPKTEYTLTTAGQKIHVPLTMLCQWARANEEFLSDIHEKRKRSIK